MKDRCRQQDRLSACADDSALVEFQTLQDRTDDSAGRRNRRQIGPEQQVFQRIEQGELQKLAVYVENGRASCIRPRFPVGLALRDQVGEVVEGRVGKADKLLLRGLRELKLLIEPLDRARIGNNDLCLLRAEIDALLDKLLLGLKLCNFDRR